MNYLNPEFYIIAAIDDKERHIRVKPLETTDGISYFVCFIGEKEISQLRKEVYGKWEQLWGELNANAIANLGHAIEEKITPP
jgi:hypothetical protein